MIASCGIEVAASDVATECESLKGLFTFHVENDTPEETMSVIKDEMLSTLRQGMEAGRYENDVIWKITFVESAAANELKLSQGTANSLESTSQQPNNPALSITIGFVVAILIAAVVFALTIVHKKERELEHEPKHSLEELSDTNSSRGSTEWNAPDDQEDESTPDCDEVEASEQIISQSMGSHQAEEPVLDATFTTTDENENTDAGEKTEADENAACDVSVEELEQERIKAEERLEMERHASERLLEAERRKKEELEQVLEQEREKAEERLKKERLEAEQMLETERLKVVNMLNSLDWDSQ